MCSVGSPEHLSEGFAPFHFFEEFGVVFDVFEISFPQFREFCLFFGFDHKCLLDYNGHVSFFTSFVLRMMRGFGVVCIIDLG